MYVVLIWNLAQPLVQLFSFVIFLTANFAAFSAKFTKVFYIIWPQIKPIFTDFLFKICFKYHLVSKPLTATEHLLLLHSRASKTAFTS